VYFSSRISSPPVLDTKPPIQDKSAMTTLPSAVTSIVEADLEYPSHLARWSSADAGNITTAVATPSAIGSASMAASGTIASANARRRMKLVTGDTTIRHVVNYDSTTGTDTTTRRGHLLVLLPLTQRVSQEQRELVDFRVYVELSAFLAFQHIQNKSALVLPHVQQRIQDCDFEWTYRHADTQFSPQQAAKELLASMDLSGDHTQPQHDQQQQPFAVLGAARSAVTKTLSVLAGAMELPLISSSSTSSSLDGSPFFARTIASNRVDARALMTYLRYHLQLDYVGVLFLHDTWGRQYQQELVHYARHYNITLYSVPYLGVDNASLDRAMQQIGEIPARYWIGIIDPSAWKPVVRAAYKWGLMGNYSSDKHCQWFLGDLVELRSSTFVLNATTEYDIAQALHGVGMPFWQVHPHDDFDRALAGVAQDMSLQRAFKEHHREPHLLDNFTFSLSPARSVYQYFTYDAVVALSITACETPGLFTGKEFFQKLLEVDFDGVSGRVRLNSTTGTRLEDGLEYEMINLLLNPSDNDTITFEARTSATIDLSSNATGEDQASGIPVIAVLNPFIFQNNGTNPPLQLPPVESDMNLIPSGIRAFGIALGVCVMALSMGCAIWTIVYRNAYVVKAAQPVFLIAICLGALMVSSTVILLSFQEDMPLNMLDFGCGAMPWMLCLGYVGKIAVIMLLSCFLSQLGHGGSLLSPLMHWRITPLCTGSCNCLAL
jgi:Receptor family ligand binding region